MKLVIQRVTKAEVKGAGKIEKGLFVLLGIKKGDLKETAENLAEKLVKLRVMSDQEDKMNLSIKDAGGKILLVSQFTLYGNTKGGNRPSFIEAEEPQKAREIYEFFIEKLSELGVEVETGIFGKYMDIEANLDGPVTIVVEE